MGELSPLHTVLKTIILKQLQRGEEEKVHELHDEEIDYITLHLQKEMTVRVKSDDAPPVPALKNYGGLQPVIKGTQYPGFLQRLMVGNGMNSNCDIVLGISMYNEGVRDFKNTLGGVMKNLKAFKQYNTDLKRILCIVIVDGVKAFLSMVHDKKNAGADEFFSDFYNEEQIKRAFAVDSVLDCKIPGENDYDEFAHTFVLEIQSDIGEGNHLQMVFCIKQKNKRKLNSHLWLFGGFCYEINPKYVMLLDVGTKPERNALFHLYEAMEVDPQLGGCCGEIKPINSTFWNVVVSAQEVEYKFAHIFDKALESVFGYITVLPGAFSAYRWEAMQGAPLKEYMKSIRHPEKMDCFTSNIYLAEDRVLCLALVTKKDCNYTLRYVRKSVASTDVPESLPELMSQRRRWVNGSWFAIVSALSNFRQLRHSNHSYCRQCALYFEMLYYYVNVVFSWLMVGSFFLVFAIAVRTEFDYNDDSEWESIGNYIVISYIFLLMVTFILSLAAKPKRIEKLMQVISSIMGALMLFTVYLMFSVLFDDQVSANTRILIGATLGLFITNMVANCAVLVICKGILHFLFMTPTYVNIFLIYAICNIHDCSWGNRPDLMTDEEKRNIEDFEVFRARWCIVWVITNGGFGYALNGMDKDDGGNFIYLAIIAALGGGILVIRTLFGLMYLCIEGCCKSRAETKWRKKREEGQLGKEGQI